MLSAFLSGFFGASLTYWVGARYFGFGFDQSMLAVAVSNVSGFVALLLTLALERRALVRRILMGNAFKTWFVLVVFYVGGLVALDSSLRDPKTLAALVGPLIWATGFMIPLWGVTQDWVLRFEQRQAKKRRFSSANQQFARPERDAIRVES